MYSKEQDVTHKLCNWLDHNRWLAGGLAAGALLAVLLLGCRAKTISLAEPGRRITAEQFQLEVIDLTASLERRAAQIEQERTAYNSDVAALNKKVEAGQADLQRQAEIRAQVIEFAGGLIATAASGGALTPGAAAGAALQLLTLLGLAGAAMDNRRKDKVIEQTKQTEK
jgi:hypothetical protein